MMGIDDAIAAGSTLVTTIANKIAPDANIEVQGKVTQALQEMQNEYALLLGQIEINKIEANSEHIFISGWRPAVGWVSASALAYSAILEPIMRFVAEVCFEYVGKFPEIDTTITLQVLLAMLGFGAMRTYEKQVGK
jgi:hypothetical protein